MMDAPICLKSELDLFSSTPVQLAIEDSTIVEIHPLATISPNSPLEFHISGSGEQYLDLAHTILHLQVKIVKKTGANLEDTDAVGPINYALNTMFSECSVYLNDKLVSNQVNYGFRAIVESLLFSSKAAQESMLSSAGFYRDTALKHDDLTTANTGFTKRKLLSATSKLLDLTGPLHFDLASQPKLIPNGVSVRIKLERAKDSFVLMAATDDYKMELLSASLHVRKVDVAASVMLAQEKALSKGLMKIPIRRVEVKTFALSKSLQSHTLPNAFLSELPSRVIIGLVSNESFNGQISKNPFNFTHFNLNYLCLVSNGRMIPAKPYKPDYEGNVFGRAYLSMFTNLGRYHRSQNIPINYKEYPNGYNLYIFDLTPDFAGNESHKSINKTGNIAIDLKFASTLTETLNLIIYSEFRSSIDIDSSRNVYCNF